MTRNEHSLETSHNVQKCHDHEEQAKSEVKWLLSVSTWNGTMRMKWACPKYGGGRVVWCGPCLRRWVCPHVREGSGWLCRGEGRGGHSSADSTDSTCALNRW